jgi:predicted nucleic acid-binding protein
MKVETAFHPPSDAVIALICKHYGIGAILTFDEDFKRVPRLKVIP